MYRVSKNIRNLLNEKVLQYNVPAFIEDDPVRVPRSFSERENIEISGFLAAMLAWGRRDVIIRNTLDLLNRMDNRPLDFLMNMEEADLEGFRDFRHRTFQAADCVFFLQSLQRIYREEGGLYNCFNKGYWRRNSIKDAILHFREVFLHGEHTVRSRKHLPDPSRGSAAKRINLFLRWMVRRDDRGVDFGIWEGIRPADLYIPLDVHTGNVARQLGILKRRQNDWKAVEELTGVLRQMDPNDPVKYDYALFGLGMYEKS